MRKVLFKKWIDPIIENGKVKPGSNCFGELITEGLFHEWGTSYEEFETNSGNYSVALVECTDGTIEEVLPCNLIFINL